MHILALDTATKSCSVAVTDDTSILAELTVVTQETHAKHLMGMIDQAVELSGLAFSDIDGFAVSKGPGSFTGLRIGIATAKGLATASEKPLVGVSTLHALAMQTSHSTFPICSLLDARRGEVYYSQYRNQNGVLKARVAETLLAPEAIIDHIHEPCVFIGSGAILYHDIIIAHLGDLAFFAPEPQNTIRASTIAHISKSQFDARHTDDLETFVPVYIRKSDAEINAAKARKSDNG